MASVVLALLWLAVVVVAVPVVVLWLQVLLAWPQRRAGLPGEGAVRSLSDDDAPRCAVLVPAHNEEAVIAGTVRRLRAQLDARDTLLVVADNCTDATSRLAMEAGATVIERTDATRRGKGYALDHGVRYLAALSHDVIVVIDADCAVFPLDGVRRLAAMAVFEEGPVQCLDLMDAPDGAPIKTRVAAFAWRLKNWVRPLGWRALGLPCQLMGTGMAFPWAIAQRMQLANAELAEDMQLGIDLALAGTPPRLCPQVLVRSTFPASAQATQGQRRRWEHGHLGMMARQLPRLLGGALRQRDVRSLALALDLGVPPLALLVLLLLGVSALCAAAVVWGAGSGPLWSVLACMALLAMAVGMAWWGWGRAVVSARDLLSVPWYVLGKLPLYLGYMFKRQKEWVKTDRE